MPATIGEEREVPDHSALATAPFEGTTRLRGVAPKDIRPVARMSGSGRPRAVGPRLENGTTSPYDWLEPFSRPAQRREEKALGRPAGATPPPAGRPLDVPCPLPSVPARTPDRVLPPASL